ncbi:ferric reductase like transmembrane component-domain-containing protein [Penicillium malachiteum]|nr:ferric reductase like transmembrane component-domain-containing protein [Penicillium malachiteum]
MGLEKGDIYTGAVCLSIKVVGNTTDLPLYDPYCNTDACLAFKKAHAASQKAVSYAHQFDYGHYTVWTTWCTERPSTQNPRLLQVDHV